MSPTFSTRQRREVGHDQQSRGSHRARDNAYDGFYADMSNALPPQSRNIESRSRQQDPNIITPNDIVIAVMGVTGAGKSTFISHFCDEVKIGSGLKSCTEEVQPFLYSDSLHCYGKRLYMVDTPGFDDSGSGKSDTDILGDIAAFLSDTYQNNILLTGVIYLHRISDNRVGGSGLRQMKMFRQLCGEQSMANVVVATTMWSLAAPDEAKQREHELMTEDGFFKQMMRNGAKMVRQDRGKDSAFEIVTRLIHTSRPGALNIQEEMVDRHKRLDETAAGQVVEAELSKLREKHENELKALRDEMQEALELKDYVLAEEIETIRADIERRLQQEQEASRRLQQSHSDLIKRMQDQHRDEQRRLQDMMESQRREHNLMAQNLQKATQVSSQMEDERRKREKLQKKITKLEKRIDRAENNIAHGYCEYCDEYNEWENRVGGYEFRARCWNCDRSQWWS